MILWLTGPKFYNEIISDFQPSAGWTDRIIIAGLNEFEIEDEVTGLVFLQVQV